MKGMNMESYKKNCQFDTHKKNHWNIIVAKDYGFKTKYWKWNGVIKLKSP
jgi:hypothetical protein